MKRVFIFLFLIIMFVPICSCSSKSEITAPVDESYIKTYTPNDDMYSRAPWPTMEYLASNSFAVEFTVTGEYTTYETELFDEENYNLSIADKESRGIVMTEEEKKQLKEQWYTMVHTSILLPVKYGEVLVSSGEVTSDLDAGTLRYYLDVSNIKEMFPVGARFLMISWDSMLDPPLNVPPLNEYVFYIDSENRLTPVFDIPTLADYKGYTVDEFIEEVKPLFEKDE